MSWASRKYDRDLGSVLGRDKAQVGVGVQVESTWPGRVVGLG